MTSMPALICILLSQSLASAAQPSAQELVQNGMKAFKENKITESLGLFDAAATAGYPEALLWQRGISLYYAGRMEEGSRQFRKDVEMNPNDTEESIWAMMCEAKLYGFAESRSRILKVGRDSRPVMRMAYSLFSGDDDDRFSSELEGLAKHGSLSEKFYAALYLGLFAEAQGHAAIAEKWFRDAIVSEYARTNPDYMVDTARVHFKLRGWGGSGLEEL